MTGVPEGPNISRVVDVLDGFTVVEVADRDVTCDDAEPRPVREPPSAPAGPDTRRTEATSKEAEADAPATPKALSSAAERPWGQARREDRSGAGREESDGGMCLHARRQGCEAMGDAELTRTRSTLSGMQVLICVGCEVSGLKLTISKLSGHWIASWLHVSRLAQSHFVWGGGLGCIRSGSSAREPTDPVALRRREGPHPRAWVPDRPGAHPPACPPSPPTAGSLLEIARAIPDRARR